VSKPQRDPGTIKRLQSAATNVVQTAACRPQNHLCLGTFQEASLNIIGNARLVSLVGPVVFIRFWFKKGERKSVRDALRPSTAMGLGVAARSFRQLREDRRRAGGRRQAGEWTRSKQHSPSRDDPKRCQRHHRARPRC
jgi:hypothetical protein